MCCGASACMALTEDAVSIWWRQNSHCYRVIDQGLLMTDLWWGGGWNELWNLKALNISTLYENCIRLRARKRTHIHTPHARLRFHLSLFLKVVNNNPPLVQIMAWRQATSHYINQWCLDFRRIYASLGFIELNEHLSISLNNGLQQSTP